ncbi:hypothetical protein PMALA_046770 [Plasmodium malariae]|uniref:Uncharacterized protein n=1 Tax=Plasmodium malariae TaxID=5858 RepID=A0A1A8WSL4_PLAMA|nr:hypothetical protein PMALA_046770 [Plasmodium malariae]
MYESYRNKAKGTLERSIKNEMNKHSDTSNRVPKKHGSHLCERDSNRNKSQLRDTYNYTDVTNLKNNLCANSGRGNSMCPMRITEIYRNIEATMTKIK